MVLLLPAQPGFAADAALPPTDVLAKYNLSFNSLDVGSYSFSSHVDAKGYQASSEASISALFGAYKWKGTINTSGAITKATPKPAGYVMNFKTKSKQGSITLGFKGADIASVQLVPSKPPNPEAVPLKPEHYKNVFDPLSAIFAMTLSGTGKNPCDKRVPIFDGKARFDLTMSYKKTEKIADKQPSGQPQELIVCRVKYQPIAGHKPKDFENPWVDYKNIEIALRPIPSAGIHVPYRITVPTTLGAAEMRATSVTISTPDRPQIALTQ